MKHIKISPQRYRWVIVAASFLMVFVCLGFCSSSKSLYLAAITEALGIKRSLFSINDSCRYIATAVVNLFFGALCARFGRKRLIAAGFACLIASMLLYAYAPNIYLFYLGGVLLGLGLAWTTTTMVGSIVHRWCPADKLVENGGCKVCKGGMAFRQLQKPLRPSSRVLISG